MFHLPFSFTYRIHFAMCVFVTKIKQLFSIATETNILYAVSSNSKIASNFTSLLLLVFHIHDNFLLFLVLSLNYYKLSYIQLRSVIIHGCRIFAEFCFKLIKPINSVLGDLFANCSSTRNKQKN